MPYVKNFLMDQLVLILKADNFSFWCNRSAQFLLELSVQDQQYNLNSKMENIFIFLFNHPTLQTVNICDHFILFKKYNIIPYLSIHTSLNSSLTNDMRILRLLWCWRFSFRQNVKTGSSSDSSEKWWLTVFKLPFNLFLLCGSPVS